MTYNSKVLALATSHQRDGNTETLLDRMIEGMKESGATVEKIFTPDLDISPCRACNSCLKTGRCIINDDYQVLYEKFLSLDRIVFTSPLYFMNLCSQAKVIVDRTQCLWSMKNKLKYNPFTENRISHRKGVLISCGGTKGKHLFDCVRLTMKYFFDAIYMDFWGYLCVSQADERGAILNHPERLEEAFQLGKNFVAEEN